MGFEDTDVKYDSEAHLIEKGKDLVWGQCQCLFNCGDVYLLETQAEHDGSLTGRKTGG